MRPNTERGKGQVLGSPGVYHYAAPHQNHPSTQYGFGAIVESLCGRTTGISYNEDTLHNLFPEDRLCKWCARRV